MKVALNGLPEFAENILQSFDSAPAKPHATLVALQGDLGAGKTTFVQALARALCVTETVQSPTYVLMKKYQVTNTKFQTLVHLDLYRLEKPEELAALKLESVFADPKCLVCVEWPERAEKLLPQPDLTLRFSHKDAGAAERYIEMV
jgi:tRNA threonylcarbamoyladenosine biosynthesis protein TsaE